MRRASTEVATGSSPLHPRRRAPAAGPRGARSGDRLSGVEVVLDAHDVVLLEVGAGLDLDDLDGDPAQG